MHFTVHNNEQKSMGNSIAERNAKFYRDDAGGFYGFAAVGPNQFNPSIFINVNTNTLQLRYADTGGINRLYDFSLTRK